MKTVNIILLCFFVFFCIISCEKCEYPLIKFENSSEKPIYITYDVYYPDTLSVRLGISLGKDFKVEPNSYNTTAFNAAPKGWETLFKRISSDTLMIYVFDAVKTDDPNDHTPMKDRILRRYDLSIEDLQRMDWILYYPPTEAMKDIKMWPPYGQ
jgi:hypothetical protein